MSVAGFRPIRRMPSDVSAPPDASAPSAAGEPPRRMPVRHRHLVGYRRITGSITGPVLVDQNLYKWLAHLHSKFKLPPTLYAPHIDTKIITFALPYIW